MAHLGVGNLGVSSGLLSIKIKPAKLNPNTGSWTDSDNKHIKIWNLCDSLILYNICIMNIGIM